MASMNMDIDPRPGTRSSDSLMDPTDPQRRRLTSNTQAKISSDLGHVLWVLMMGRNSPFDPKLSNREACAAVIVANIDLRDLLIAENFTEVLKHPSLTVQQPRLSTLTIPELDADGAFATRQAWKAEYCGDSAALFVEALHTMNNDVDRKVYDNFFPVIQSSGTGKSRMVDEAAKRIFTLPFSLRSEDDSSGTILQTGLPFDNYPETIVKESIMKLKDVATVGHLVKFGRPLFWTPLGIDNDREVFRWKYQEEGELAAASVRLLFDFEPRRAAAAQLESRLVEGHMRIAYSVPDHREYLCSGAPSEPLLAEAAGRILHLGWRDKAVPPKIPALVHLVSETLDKGLLSKGEPSELVAKLLLTLAHDACVTTTHDAAYSQPISLLKFLEALVGEANMEIIRRAKADNVPGGGQTFEEAFQSAQINFTHFAKGEDDHVNSDEASWIALARCMAWQCANGQYMIDLYIPLLLWDEALGRFVVSGIFVRAKNRRQQQEVAIDVEKLGFFSPGGGTRAETRPYITLTLELGIPPRVTPKTQSSPATPSKLSSNEPAPTKQPVQVKETTPKNNHPRYAISIVGCSSSVYKVIGSDGDIYTRLLSVKDVVEEHPRRSQKFLDAVLRMKPYWTDGSFHWVEKIGPIRSYDIDNEGRGEGVYASAAPDDDV
ncbi:hypothetical protein Hypma_012066 [Hypsizygus marmoreus]|uniref:Uncharacterized protein n=1 Tax=Hypsizygus marmoreus TaxID=39966 RepID=A0A369JI92_HYPMA|nr:hypothetical protein Hypma_012066 [Hypsizygus marmoreus]